MTKSRRQGVVLLHGFGSIPGTMWPLTWTFRQAGYSTLTPFYPSWRMPLSQIVNRLRRQVAAFAANHEGGLHFVGHSMGGLVIRALLHKDRLANLGNVVMLGTPNSGSEIADYLALNPWTGLILGQARPTLITRRDAELIGQLGHADYPVGIIAGSRAMIEGPFASLLPTPHDGKVSVAATHLDGETDHIVMPVTHSLLPSHGGVRKQTLHFIENGHFAQ